MELKSPKQIIEKSPCPTQRVFQLIGTEQGESLFPSVTSLTFLLEPLLDKKKKNIKKKSLPNVKLSSFL